MQTTSSQFSDFAAGQVRPLSWELRISFDKEFDNDVTFFELDTSLLNGIDLLAPSDGNVVQEWDKYDYANYTGRVMDLEWQREEDVPFSVSLAIADITLDNHDDYFTRGAGSAIDADLLPRRPLRILSGFNGENIPQFVGLSTKIPEIEYTARTAKIHAEDFLSFLFNKPLDQTVMYINQRTDEILSDLFQLFGLIPDQFNLQEGYNTVPFAYFEKGMKLGGAVQKLVQAELGSLYMDELGVIQFKNRFKQTTTPVYYFDKSNIVDFKLSDQEKIINVVEVKSAVRQVQDTQVVYDLASPLTLQTGNNEFFFDFEDPVTSIETIDAYLANTLSDGTGTNVTADVSVVSSDLFSTAVKVTFDNDNAGVVYLTAMTIYGTPAKVIKNIYLRAQDDDSIEAFEEQPIEIDNEFIQDDDAANSLALSIINYYKDYGNTIDLEVVGTPALQLGDTIQVDIDNISGEYLITKITNTLEPGRFRQILQARVYNIPNFFTLSSDDTAMSLLNGDDVLSP